MRNNSHLHEPLKAGEVIRLLLIGAGKMGRAHAEAFKVLDGVEIVGVVSAKGESAARLAAEFGIRQSGTDWQKLADETFPNACVIAVSHLLNETITTEVIDRELHVLAEKPVAFSSSAISRLAARAKGKNVMVMAAMNRRFYPSVLTAIDLIRFQGPLLGVTVVAPDPVRPFRAKHKYDPQVYDKWIRTNTIHAIDLLRLVGGEVISISGDTYLHEGIRERSIVATLQFREGALGCFISHSGSGGLWELRMHGDGVEACLAPLERGTIRIGGKFPRALPSSQVPGGIKPGLRAQAMAFCELIRSGGISVPPVSDLDDHARTMELVERIEGLSDRKQQFQKNLTAYR